MAGKKKGVLYGVGVGPGDPELLTLKACRIINGTKYIAYPGKSKEEALCCKIVEPVIEEPEEKIYISCHIRMTKDREILDRDYELAVAAITAILEKGENVVFLTLGDPAVYATYIYVHDRVKRAGFQAEMISGVPSFCAAAARLGISLAERAQTLHVIPSSYGIEEAFSYGGTKIFMKSASKLKDVKECLSKYGGEVYMVENCGLEGERVFRSVEEIDENSGYLSLIIVKDNPEDRR